MAGQWLIVLTLALALVFPVSSLLRRRLPMQKVIMMIITWGSLFGAVALVFRAAGL